MIYESKWHHIFLWPTQFGMLHIVLLIAASLLLIRNRSSATAFSLFVLAWFVALLSCNSEISSSFQWYPPRVFVDMIVDGLFPVLLRSLLLSVPFVLFYKPAPNNRFQRAYRMIAASFLLGILDICLLLATLKMVQDSFRV